MKIDSVGLSEQLRMMRGASAIEPIQKTQSSQADKSNGVSFADFLKQQMNEVNNVSLEAENQIKKSITGEVENPHTAVLAIQKADISFRLFLSMKQRIEQAYQQIVRTQM